jgi:hypothetical protein
MGEVIANGLNTAIVRDDSEYSANYESMKRHVIKKAA